jgi:multiple sugar transport system permease protein
VVGCVAALLLYPIAYNLWLSLHDVSLVSFVRGGSAWVGLGNYRALLEDPLFRRVAVNAMLFLVVSVAFQLTVGFLLALLFDRPFPLNGIYRSFVLLPWFIPVLVSGTVFRWIFSERGLINGWLLAVGVIDNPIPWITDARYAIWSVVAANIWLGIPFNFIMVLTGLKSIPPELYECAELDGAGEVAKVVHITIPLLKPVLLTTVLLGTIFTVKVFDLVWVITRGGPGGASHLFSTYSYALALEQFRFGYGSAVIMIMVGAMTLLTLFLNRVRVE